MVAMIIQGESPESVPHNRANLVPENYTAFGSFNPIYRDVWKTLFNDYPAPFARQVFSVIQSISMFCSDLGIHWAGIGQIMELAHYGESGIRRAYAILEEKNWMRKHTVVDPTNPKRPLTRYQLSPWVLWIQPASINDAMNLWIQSAPLCCNEMFNGEPDTESRTTDTDSEKQIQNQPYNHNQHPEQSALNVHKSQTRKRPSGAKSEQTTKAPKTTKFYPGEIPVELCTKPCTDQRDESLAQAVAKQFPMHVPQARQIVASYGMAAVTMAIDDMKVQAQSGLPIQNPAGFLRSLLRKKKRLQEAQSAAPEITNFFER